MKKRILITGSNGLLGQKLVDLLSKQASVDLIATARGNNRLPETEGYTYASLDITSKSEVLDIFNQFKPHVVIHAAAMTNVDTCETDREGCDILNVSAVAYLIEACEKHETYLCHLSTDFIFDGADGPYTEEGIANPISYYGESKLKAEQVLFASNIHWSIARTVLVYGIVPDMSRSNIVLWVKKSLEDGKTIQVVTDQFRTPTLAEDLAMGCWLLAKDEVEGIFNISGSDFLTPYEMAVMTADYYGLDKSLLQKADSSTFTQTAKRPAKTGFILDKAKKVLGYSPKTFQEGIAIMAQQVADLI